ncbi:MAG: hypothetical protein LBU58_12050, partial [Clostridiales bacterium]|nr:hypothetical protein [Clostridiales bacterium]
MFGNRKKQVAPVPVVELRDAEGNSLFVGPISALTLTEELIVKKSIEFFSDGEPCFIHRGAVAT